MTGNNDKYFTQLKWDAQNFNTQAIVVADWKRSSWYLSMAIS